MFRLISYITNYFSKLHPGTLVIHTKTQEFGIIYRKHLYLKDTYILDVDDPKNPFDEYFGMRIVHKKYLRLPTELERLLYG